MKLPINAESADCQVSISHLRFMAPRVGASYSAPKAGAKNSAPKVQRQSSAPRGLSQHELDVIAGEADVAQLTVRQLRQQASLPRSFSHAQPRAFAALRRPLCQAGELPPDSCNE